MSEKKAGSPFDNPNDFSEGRYQFSAPLMDQRERLELERMELVGGEIVSYTFGELFEEEVSNPAPREEPATERPTQADYLEAIRNDPTGLARSLEARHGGWTKPTTGFPKSLCGQVQIRENIIAPAIHIFRAIHREIERNGMPFDKGLVWLQIRQKHDLILKEQVRTIFESRRKEEFLTFGVAPSFRDWLIERADWTIGLEYPKGIKPILKPGKVSQPKPEKKRGRPKTNERAVVQIIRYKDEYGKTWKEIGQLLNRNPEAVRKAYQREKKRSK